MRELHGGEPDLADRLAHLTRLKVYKAYGKCGVLYLCTEQSRFVVVDYLFLPLKT